MATDVYRTPLLTARETARHLRMPESTLNVWLAKPSTAPLVHSVTPEKRGWPRVPFVGIIEAYVLRSPPVARRQYGRRTQGCCHRSRRVWQPFCVSA